MRGMIIGLVGFILMLAPRAEAATYRQEFPYPKAAVYAALVKVLPENGFKIKAQDPVVCRVTASAGISAFSMGENLSIGVSDGGTGKSVLELDGHKKMNAGLLAPSRVMAHFDRIVLAVSRELQASAAH